MADTRGNDQGPVWWEKRVAEVDLHGDDQDQKYLKLSPYKIQIYLSLAFLSPFPSDSKANF